MSHASTVCCATARRLGGGVAPTGERIPPVDLPDRCTARELCTEHGATDPDTLARQLLILIDGAITVALVMGDHSAADNAQCMARKLLDL